MTDKKILVAMSGGVDSSVAAYLALQDGFNCIGATLHLFDPATLFSGPQCTCNASDSIKDAQTVAQLLNIPFHILDASDAFCEKVIETFIKSYEQGYTPNPCQDCNRHIKFDDLLQKAVSLDCTHIATGHYAKVRYDEHTGRYLLYKATDLSKDQSYFLSCLSQHQLARVLFPLGDLTKDQVRQIADKMGFINAKRKDSQDICFIPDGNYVDFIKRYTGKKYPCGNLLDADGNVVGQHNGAICYTIGQRKGLGYAAGKPVYVCDKDMSANTVTVGADEALYYRCLRADSWNWIPFPELKKPMRVSARIRYRHKEQPATVYPEADGFARVEFDEPQRAITKGQTVVLYDNDLVIGGGRITDVL